MRGEAVWESVVAVPAHRAYALFLLLRRTALAAAQHDVLTVSQATAYSAVVALFPGLIVAAAVVAILPDNLPVRQQMAEFFGRVLPSTVRPLLEASFATTDRGAQTASALPGSAVVSVLGAANIMSTLMEGFRRAHELPEVPRSFWRRRRRAVALVPLCLIPLALASGLVVFGRAITEHLEFAMPAVLQGPAYALTLGLRWSVALAGSVGIIAVVYHLGTDLNIDVLGQIEPMLREPWVVLRREWSWRASLPGATLATLLWFVSTLLFGWYVTRFANYDKVYGSLGAGIALMFWLYLIALSVLIGAEFNAQRAAKKRGDAAPQGSGDLPWVVSESPTLQAEACDR